MDHVIVYLDEATYARQQLVPLRSGPTHWVLVACPPRMTQRSGKWVSHSAREQWRRRWSARLFAQLQPMLQSGGDRVSTIVAGAALPLVTRELIALHGACRVVDARRPKFGDHGPGATGDLASQERGYVPGELASMPLAPVLPGA